MVQITIDKKTKKEKNLPFNSCLGPVKNLEKHVQKEWWNQIFNSLYLKTDGDVVDDQKITSQEVEFFSDVLKLERHHDILDLCCGQGRHSLELSKRGFTNIIGLDRSRFLVQKARKNAKKNGLIVKFKEGDARNLPFQPDTFDAIMILGNSFGYFETIQEDLRVLKETFRVLKPWGKILLDLTDGDYLMKNYQPRSWEWIDKNLFVCRERSLSLDLQRLISREVVNHVNKGVLVDQFYAERLYSKDKISDMLEKVGFSDIIDYGTISPNSSRNQDLGMMEQRIIITASAKKKWTESPVKSKKEIKNITVILGDPSKPDVLKPLMIFDDDDYYTIDQLKGALMALDGYKFHYLTNHDMLINDLIKMRGNIDYVLNLCDEGYYNNAYNELHVPALLEILKIPYTGAGPQCLAFCYDKSLVRGIAKEMNVPVPEAVYLRPEDRVIDLPLYFPVIVKPNFGDSSFGITQKCVAHDGTELMNAVNEIREKFGYDRSILVEQFLPGKDLTLGIIGNPPTEYIILPISEDDYSSLPSDLPKICGYEAKWLPTSPYWNIKSRPAELTDEAIHIIESSSLQLFQRLECRDYARFDWRLDAEGNPKLLEVNPNPGWCWDGHLAKMANYANLSYNEMLKSILEAAEKRLGMYNGSPKPSI